MQTQEGIRPVCPFLLFIAPGRLSDAPQEQDADPLAGKSFIQCLLPTTLLPLSNLISSIEGNSRCCGHAYSWHYILAGTTSPPVLCFSSNVGQDSNFYLKNLNFL
jgi:hypothetical protein